MLREGIGRDTGKGGLGKKAVAEVDLGVGVLSRWDSTTLNGEDKVAELGECIGVGVVGAGAGAVKKWKGGLEDEDGQGPSKEG